MAYEGYNWRNIMESSFLASDAAVYLDDIQRFRTKKPYEHGVSSVKELAERLAAELGKEHPGIAAQCIFGETLRTADGTCPKTVKEVNEKIAYRALRLSHLETMSAKEAEELARFCAALSRQTALYYDRVYGSCRQGLLHNSSFPEQKNKNIFLNTKIFK